MSLLLMWILASSADARSLAGRTSGPWIDAGIGLDVAGKPVRAGPGWMASTGWWAGKYDDAYSLGRYMGVGATLRQNLLSDALSTSGLLEFRRGMDLIVVGLHGFIGGGLTRVGDHSLGAARLGFGAKLRRHRYWGVTVRVEGGIDVPTTDSAISPAFAVLLGGGFARPKRPKAD